MATTLLFLTNKFPFGLGEAFIETEIIYLSRVFDRVLIFPIEDVGSEVKRRPLPTNVSVVNPIDQKIGKVSFLRRSMMAISMWDAILMDFLDRGHKGRFSIKGIKRALHGAVNAGRIREGVNRLLVREQIDVVYSFWSNYGAAGAISALKKNKRKVPFVCRAHGYDLFWERQDPPFVIFQSYIVKGSDRYHPDSLNGESYLKMKYPRYSEKITTRYLGTRSMGRTTPSNDGIFRIFSCSSLIPLKRVHLIPEALSLIEGNVKWTHFGDGPERDRIISAIEKLRVRRSGIEAVLRGQVSNAELMDHYRYGNVDLFLHMSEHEGLPVSIMEALSFSVPVVAADSGGIRELVGPSTGCGRLLPHNPTCEEIAAAVREFMMMDDKSDHSERESAFKVWDAKVNADRNFISFSSELMGISVGLRDSKSFIRPIG